MMDDKKFQMDDLLGFNPITRDDSSENVGFINSHNNKCALQDAHIHVHEDANLRTSDRIHNNTSVPYNFQRPELPKFNKKDLNFWFLMVESEFRASRIDDDDIKFNAVMRALDESTARQLADIVGAQIDNERYAVLKQTILDRFKNPRQSELNLLLKDLVLGDKKPSELLREMRILAKDDVKDGLLHELWLERLPATIKPLLAMSEGMSLNGLAEMADRILFRIKESSVSAASFTQQPKTTAEISSLHRSVDELRRALTTCLEEIKDIRTERRSRSRLRSKSQSRSGFSRASTPNRGGICWYHAKFGLNATKCGGEGCKFESLLKPGNADRCHS